MRHRPTRSQRPAVRAIRNNKEDPEFFRRLLNPRAERPSDCDAACRTNRKVNIGGLPPRNCHRQPTPNLRRSTLARHKGLRRPHPVLSRGQPSINHWAYAFRPIIVRPVPSHVFMHWRCANSPAAGHYTQWRPVPCGTPGVKARVGTRRGSVFVHGGSHDISGCRPRRKRRKRHSRQGQLAPRRPDPAVDGATDTLAQPVSTGPEP